MNNEYITYEDFGARADGVYDDIIAIRNAHNYANANNVEVRANGNKEYHIFGYYNDPVIINTSVDWGNANFIIHDEDIDEKSCRFRNLFIVSSNIMPMIIDENIVSQLTINKNTKSLSQLKSTLSGYNKSS